MVMYQFALFSIILLPLHYCIPYTFDPNVKSVQRIRIVFQVCVILWITIASVILFFGTRIMKLRAFGDTSLQQTVREQLVESQRNAAHDIRNALMEVIGLVDMYGNKNKKDSKRSTEKLEKFEKFEKEIFEKKTEERSNSSSSTKSTNSNSELEHNSDLDLNFNTSSYNEKQPSLQLQQQHKQQGGGGDSDPQSNSDLDKNKLSLRVHDVTKRILHRLDASLRDEQNVVQNNSTRLYPGNLIAWHYLVLF